MKKTISSLRGEVMFLLEKYALLHEEVSAMGNPEGICVTFVRKNDTRQFQQLIHYLNQENHNYTTYFCPKAKRIKLIVFTEPLAQ